MRRSASRFGSPTADVDGRWSVPIALARGRPGARMTARRRVSPSKNKSVTPSTRGRPETAATAQHALMPTRVEPSPRVAELLAASIAAHDRARQQTRVVDKHRVVTRPRDKTMLQEAYDLRVQALALDPLRKDPAWQAEQRFTATGRDTHLELMAFYREQLG